MNKQQLVKDMKGATGSSFITLKELTTYLGHKDPQKIRRKYCTGLERVGVSYFIPDVVDRIMEARSI